MTPFSLLSFGHCHQQSTISPTCLRGSRRRVWALCALRGLQTGMTPPPAILLQLRITIAVVMLPPQLPVTQ